MKSPCKWRISWVSLETKPEATDRLLASPLSPWRVLDSSRSTSSLNTLPSLQTPSTSYTCSWQDVASKTKCEDYSRMFLIISKHTYWRHIHLWLVPGEAVILRVPLRTMWGGHPSWCRWCACHRCQQSYEILPACWYTSSESKAPQPATKQGPGHSIDYESICSASVNEWFHI